MVPEKLMEEIGKRDADMMILSFQESFKTDIDTMMARFREQYPNQMAYRLGGLITVVFSKHPETNRGVKYIRFGEFGIIPRKGCIALKYRGFCHVNVHLEAGENNQSKRMKQIERTLGNDEIGRDRAVVTGDMNFRVCNGSDQGIQFLEKYTKFKEFSRNELGEETDGIRRAYTYRYISDSGKIDDGRTPSFCDRIFVDKSISILEHETMDIRGSDHIPVYGMYRIDRGGNEESDERWSATPSTPMEKIGDFLYYLYELRCKLFDSIPGV
jgi:hypothetical protein